MMKRGTRVNTKDGQQGVILGSWLRTRTGYPTNSRTGTVYRRVRLDDGTVVYRTELELEAAE